MVVIQGLLLIKIDYRGPTGTNHYRHANGDGHAHEIRVQDADSARASRGDHHGDYRRNYDCGNYGGGDASKRCRHNEDSADSQTGHPGQCDGTSHDG
jgi:hypothetical protein